MNQQIQAWMAARNAAGFRMIDDALTQPHNGGRRAALFECDGKKYVYKPRGSATDCAWADFLDALEPVLGLPMPGAVRPEPPFSEDYTIVPCIQRQDCQTEAQVLDYYRRCGTLLALCMVLGSRDLHGENLIAVVNVPYLIDVELMLSGVARKHEGEDPDLYHALLNSHLLPHWSRSHSGNANIDGGGLTAYDENQPRLYAAWYSPYFYIEEIAAAFREGCRAILRNRDFIDAQLECFAHVPFRKILRPNHLYKRFRMQLAGIEDEAARIESVQRLRRAYVKGGPEFEKMMERACRSEMHALLQDELPTFFSYGGERCLRDRHGVVADDYFALSPLEAARARLHALNDAEIEAQAALIRLALRCTNPVISSVELSDAMQVFELLESMQVSNCPSAWMGLGTNFRGEADFGSVGCGLGQGLTGIMVFYASLYEAGGSEAVLQALHRCRALYQRNYLENPNRPATQSLSLTGGAGGQLLALAHCAACTGDDRFLQDGARLLSALSLDGIDFAAWDVFDGAAGLLIALPRLMGRGMDDAIRSAAAVLAEGLRGIIPERCGFGHGAAGLALALAAAQQAGGGNYEPDILRLLEWESAQFNEETLRWPDTPEEGGHGSPFGICSGAAGVALARLQLMEYAQHPRIREICRTDVARAHACIRHAPVLSCDDLCCGNGALIETERTLPDATSAHKLNPVPAHWHMLDTDDFLPGLFQGWAGIGYALVRRMPLSHHSLFFQKIHK